MDYTVVTNEEEQYSIWPTCRPIPDGWTKSNVTGNKHECLTHIEKVWRDIRPLSLRKKLQQLSEL